jgi:putative zinc finger/helix-turn-helix YgiT family protein
VRINMNNTAKKPFPWKCPVCKEKAVREAIVNHVVKVEHDGRTYSVKVDGLKTPRCDKCGEICPDAEAYEQITLAFLDLAKLLTPKQIRENRESLRLTQKEFAAAIGVAEATVSRWENGVQIQQRSSDNLLRIFFGVPHVRQMLMNQQISEIGACSISPGSIESVQSGHGAFANVATGG